jgi:hypothetical protein
VVWNKSGYHDKFSKQEMYMTDKREKEEEQRKKEAEKEREEHADIMNKITEFLNSSQEPKTLQEISESLGETDITILKTINHSKEIEKIVSPLDGSSDTSTRYKSKHS